MQRFAGVGLFLIFLLSFGLSSCGGGGGSSAVTTPPKPATVTLSPASISLEKGAVFQVSVSVKDSKGDSLFNTTPTFSSSNTSEVTVSTGGLLCAGTWDSLTTPVVCTPATMVGTSNLTATAGGITSNVVVVSVHDHVDNITLSPASVDCKSQNDTQKFTATAFNGVNNITSTVGTFSWLSNDGSVATIDVAGPATTPVVLTAFQAQVKAKNSGLTKISASISGTNSVPASFITCPPATISIFVQNTTDTSFSILTSATKQLDTKVTDTMGTIITGLTLTWTSSQPAVASVSTSGLVTGVAPGLSTITASCTPSACNVNVNQPVYSNVVMATVTGTSSTTTVYVTSKAFPASAKLIPISTSTNTVGTEVSLPQLPNSLLFSRDGAKAYLGSANGLMVMDAATNAVTTTVTNAPGIALAVSPNGNKIIVSDAANADPTKRKVYVYDQVAATVETLNISGATAAEFSPDSFKAFIVSGADLFVYAPPLALRTLGLGTTGNDVSFLATGSFGYVARTGAVTPLATCNNSLAADVGATDPKFIEPVPSGTQMLAVDSPNLLAIDAAVTDAPCPPLLSSSSTAHSFGVGFAPRQLIVLPDGSKAYVTSDLAGSLLVYNIGANAAAGSVAAAVTLANGAQSFTGGATIDSKMLYLGGNDNRVHRIDTAAAPASADVQQIAISFTGCAGCPPDLVAVRPH